MVCHIRIQFIVAATLVFVFLVTAAGFGFRSFQGALFSSYRFLRFVCAKSFFSAAVSSRSRIAKNLGCSPFHSTPSQ
jgi:hypothetical protein